MQNSFDYYESYQDKVILTGITYPLDERINSAEHFLVSQARVSNPAGEYKEEYVKLLKSLIRMEHWSPLELVSVNMKLTMPLDILGQFVRHRGFHLNVLSRRYTEQKMELFLPELRIQDQKNRQNSYAPEDQIDIMWCERFTEDIKEHFERTVKLYFQMLDKGIGKECARSILPQTTMTVANVHVNLRDLMFYIKLRLGNGTQKEHTLLAEAMLNTVKEEFPNVIEAFGLDTAEVCENNE